MGATSSNVEDKKDEKSLPHAKNQGNWLRSKMALQPLLQQSLSRSKRLKSRKDYLNNYQKGKRLVESSIMACYRLNTKKRLGIAQFMGRTGRDAEGI